MNAVKLAPPLKTQFPDLCLLSLNESVKDSDSLDRLMSKSADTIAPGVALEDLDLDALNTLCPPAAARLGVLKW